MLRGPFGEAMRYRPSEFFQIHTGQLSRTGGQLLDPAGGRRRVGRAPQLACGIDHGLADIGSLLLAGAQVHVLLPHIPQQRQRAVVFPAVHKADRKSVV